MAASGRIFLQVGLFYAPGLVRQVFQHAGHTGTTAWVVRWLDFNAQRQHFAVDMLTAEIAAPTVISQVRHENVVVVNAGAADAENLHGMVGLRDRPGFQLFPNGVPADDEVAGEAFTEASYVLEYWIG